MYDWLAFGIRRVVLIIRKAEPTALFAKICILYIPGTWFSRYFRGRRVFHSFTWADVALRVVRCRESQDEAKGFTRTVYVALPIRALLLLIVLLCIVWCMVFCLFSLSGLVCDRAEFIPLGLKSRHGPRLLRMCVCSWQLHVLSIIPIDILYIQCLCRFLILGKYKLCGDKN